MEEVMVVILSMLPVVVLVPLYLWKLRRISRSNNENLDEPQVRQREGVVRASGNKRRMCRRPASSSCASISSALPPTTDDGQ